MVNHALYTVGRALLPRQGALLSVAALAMVVVAVLMSSASARRQERAAHFTELWMIAGAQGGEPAAELGVRNQEGTAVSYRLVVSIGPRRLYSAGIRLPSASTWSASAPLPRTTRREFVQATLYRGQGSLPYRVTNLWTAAG